MILAGSQMHKTERAPVLSDVHVMGFTEAKMTRINFYVDGIKPNVQLSSFLC